MDDLKPHGVELPIKYHAFIWTGGEDQMHDPVWLVDYLKSNKAYIKTDGRGVYIKGLPGEASPGDVIVFNGLKYSHNGGVSFWSNTSFRVRYGDDALRAIAEGKT